MQHSSHSSPYYPRATSHNDQVGQTERDPLPSQRPTRRPPAAEARGSVNVELLLALAALLLGLGFGPGLTLAITALVLVTGTV